MSLLWDTSSQGTVLCTAHLPAISLHLHTIVSTYPLWLCDAAIPPPLPSFVHTNPHSHQPTLMLYHSILSLPAIMPQHPLPYLPTLVPHRGTLSPAHLHSHCVVALPMPGCAHLSTKSPGICDFLTAFPLTLLVGTGRKSHNTVKLSPCLMTHDPHWSTATRTIGIAVAKWCGHVILCFTTVSLSDRNSGCNDCS